MKKKRDQPHDRYFRDLMQDPILAKEFFQSHLDPEIQAAIDWDTLTPCDPALTGWNNKTSFMLT